MSLYQVGDACYPTQSAAAMATASTLNGSFVARGTVLYQVNVTGVTDTSISYRFTPVVSGTVVNQTIGYTAQPCGLLTSDDAVQMGWLVGAVWVAVYVLMFLGRLVRDMVNERNADNGNA